MASKNNASWNLESFMDSLVLELDKAQDTLAIKGMNRPLTYNVKEVSLDLEIFPSFDGKAVRFVTAKPGESGASRLSFQLGSITSEQIRRTTRDPIGKDDISITEIEGIDDDTKTTLEKYGIKSARDLENLEQREVPVEKIVAKDDTSRKKSYLNLASIIKKAHRQRKAPSVSKVSMSKSLDGDVLAIQGSNLASEGLGEMFPAAFLDGKHVPVIQASEGELRLRISPEQLSDGGRQLQVALDQYAVIKMNLKQPNSKNNDTEEDIHS